MEIFKKSFKSFFIIIAFFLANLLIDSLSGGIVPRLMAMAIGGQPINYIIYGVFVGQIAKSIVLIFYVKKRKKNYSGEYIKNEKIENPLIYIGVGLGTVGFGHLLVNAILKLFEGSPLVTDAFDIFEKAFSANSTIDGLVVIFVVAIGAPIVEEYLFRGVLFEELGNSKATIFLTSLVFGIYHFNIVQTPNTFFMGLVLAYVYYKTRSIKAPIIIHATNNILAMVPILDQGLTPLGVSLYVILLIVGIKALRQIA
uniref:CPBP family intramembrane glutamic endopeptidase n=1 Tax=Anaerococcus mediterraneensis TaxID=1870984 RepID=UPI0009313F51|nr:type II CAAX endopeptidase family protein [Anaerococcus mediterraneensis]